MPITDFLQGALPIAGALAGGPLGGAIGSAAAAGIGGIDASQKKRAYQSAENAIPMVDPVQQAYLARVQQQERNMRAGTDVSSALSRRLMENNLAQTQTNLLRANGPNAANNLLRSQAAGANQGAQIGANASQAANQLLSFQGGLIDHMADRVYTRQKQRRDQALQDYETAKQDANARIGAVVGMLPQLGLQFNKHSKMGPQQFKGGMVGGQYMPSVFAGIQYDGLQQPQQNSNFGFQQPGGGYYNPPPPSNLRLQ